MNEERTRWFGQAKCDFCGKQISKTLYDGKTRDDDTMWATMCERCFQRYGAGIAWGTGQKYEQDKDGNFYLTEGGCPEE